MNGRPYRDEHRWFRETVAAFVEREIRPLQDAIRRDRQIPRSVWQSAGRDGLLGLAVPEDFGGSGADDFRFSAVMQEELVRAGMAYGSAFQVHADVVAPYLVDLARPEAKERWLPAFCRGDLITAIAMTEPDAGSDLAALRTTARGDGKDWILDGSKTFITNGTTADLAVTAARADAGISLFAVELEAPGVDRGRKLSKIGQHEAGTAEIFFDSVRVPGDHLLGAPGEGFGYMVERLPTERLSAACANVAHAKHALRLTLDYVKDRRAFGRPIGSFQNSRFVLAELDTAVDVAEAYVDRCVVAHVNDRLAPVDAAKAKWWTAELQNRVLDSCVQLFGGYGYMDEYEVARAWADARVTRIWAGADEIMKEIIGRALGLGEPSPR